MDVHRGAVIVGLDGDEMVLPGDEQTGSRVGILDDPPRGILVLRCSSEVFELLGVESMIDPGIAEDPSLRMQDEGGLQRGEAVVAVDP